MALHSSGKRKANLAKGVDEGIEVVLRLIGPTGDGVLARGPGLMPNGGLSVQVLPVVSA